MKHYGDEGWADFVRDTIPPSLKQAMQRHIDAGCTQCASTLELWQRLLAIGRKERDLTPSPESLRVVASFFANVAPKPERKFRLLFDSLRQPVTAGIRGSASTRQFLYETDDLYVDLRLEKKSPICTYLVGQVLCREGQSSATQAFSVQVMDRKNLLMETTTNCFGEFQLEFTASDSLSVSIGRNRNNAEIILPLYD